MIKKHFLKTYEEAVKEAHSLFRKHREDEYSELSSITRYRKDSEGKDLPFYDMEDEETGAKAYIFSFDAEQGYSLTFFTPEEAKQENRAYPFRDVPEKDLPFLIAMDTPVFKPTKRIAPDEVLTPQGLKAVFSFFGEEALSFITKEEAQAYTIDSAFEYGEKESGEEVITSLLCIPFPEALEELTGLRIGSVEEYVSGIAKLLNTELTEEQAKEAKDSYIFYASEAFIKYAIYEFTRTENYNHLRKILSSYATFLLPDEWEREEYSPLFSYRDYRDNGYRQEKPTAEEYVIARYLATGRANIVNTPCNLKDIAGYTSIPLRLISRAYRFKFIWDF